MLRLGAVLGIALLAFTLKPSEGGVFDDTSCGNEKSHNFYFGSRSYNDKMVFMDHPKVGGSWLRKQSVDVEYPPKGEVGRQISYIEVLDQYNNGKGGCVYVKNGGVGQTFVTLHVKSQRSEGFDFFVKIYTRS